MGNPLNGSKSVMEVQLVVGLSVEDEDWVVPFGERSTSSNESQGTSDEGLGLAMNPDIQPDQDESLGEIVYPDDVWYSDDVVNGHKNKEKLMSSMKCKRQVMTYDHLQKTIGIG